MSPATLVPGEPVAPPDPSEQRSPTPSAHPYRGPDRRGVARFVIPARLPTLILLVVALAWVVASPNLAIRLSPTAVVELDAIAATLAVISGIGCVLRWRLDGIARGWWCGWALLAIGVGQLVLEPIHGRSAVGVELIVFILGALLFGRAIFGPEVDTTIRPTTTLALVVAGVLVSIVPAIAVSGSSTRADVGMAVIGGAWLLVAAGAAFQWHRGAHDTEAGWIIPVTVALALADLVPLAVARPSNGAIADRWFTMAAMSMAVVGAIGGLVRAAVHHRTRALRERIEYEREVANRQRVEDAFADRLHEMRSTVVAIEGGVATLRADEAPTTESTTESSLRAALIAEIRRLRTLVNEAPAAAGVEVFDVALVLAPTIELQRANGQEVTFVADGGRTALGRPAEVAQVLHGLLVNAAKYAPGAPVQVSVSLALDELAIRVEDAGPGIDPEYWDQIFERGFRLDPAGLPGSGIGLAVARRIIRSQDGDLWVEASETGGAAFVISIPAAPALRIVPGRAEGTDEPAVAHYPIQEAR
jgi:signal transduction histidine kinase